MAHCKGREMRGEGKIRQVLFCVRPLVADNGDAMNCVSTMLFQFVPRHCGGLSVFCLHSGAVFKRVSEGRKICAL